MTALPRQALVTPLAALLVACGGGATGDEAAATTGGESAAAPSAEAPATLERFAGTWRFSATSEAGDTLPSHTLVATTDTTGWQIDFDNRQDVPTRVVDASGDLVVYESGPYESVLRPGVRVRVLHVVRMRDDRASGIIVAQYDVSGSAAILRGRVEGTRE